MLGNNFKVSSVGGPKNGRFTFEVSHFRARQKLPVPGPETHKVTQLPRARKRPKWHIWVSKLATFGPIVEPIPRTVKEMFGSRLGDSATSSINIVLGLCFVFRFFKSVSFVIL
jgi:hypothetical protein